jgi:hypothetical protein
MAEKAIGLAYEKEEEKLRIPLSEMNLGQQ